MANQRKGGAVRKTRSIWPNIADTSGEKGVLIQPIPAYELTASADAAGNVVEIKRHWVDREGKAYTGTPTQAEIDAGVYQYVPDSAGARPHPSNTEELAEGLTKSSVEYMGRRSKTIAADSPGGPGTFEPRVNGRFK
jgi:hypothetical protein